MLSLPSFKVNSQIHQQKCANYRSRVPVYAQAIKMNQKLDFRNKQREKLVGKLTETSLNKTVVLCHGYSSHKDTTVLARLAEGLSSISVSSFRFDFSGNGESEGVFEFGNYSKEVEDLRSAIDFLKEQQKKEVIGIVGHSKGANDVLLYAAKYDDIPLVVNLASRFEMKRGIVERFGEDILKQLDDQGEVEVPRVTPEKKVEKYKLTKKSMDERLNTDMRKAASAIKKSRVLTIHGTQDQVIPVEDGTAFEQLIQNHDLFLLEGADHNFSQESHLSELTKRVVLFIESNMKS